MPLEINDQNRNRLCAIARAAGLNPDLIPVRDFSIEGDTITYRYVILDKDGKSIYADNQILVGEWMTAKVGGGSK